MLTNTLAGWLNNMASIIFLYNIYLILCQGAAKLIQFSAAKASACSLSLAIYNIMKKPKARCMQMASLPRQWRPPWGWGGWVLPSPGKNPAKSVMKSIRESQGEREEAKAEGPNVRHGEEGSFKQSCSPLHSPPPHSPFPTHATRPWEGAERSREMVSFTSYLLSWFGSWSIHVHWTFVLHQGNRKFNQVTKRK